MVIVMMGDEIKDQKISHKSILQRKPVSSGVRTARVQEAALP